MPQMIHGHVYLYKITLRENRFVCIPHDASKMLKKDIHHRTKKLLLLKMESTIYIFFEECTFQSKKKSEAYERNA
jgi:hypothetical protein